MASTLAECIEDIKSATNGHEVRFPIVAAFKFINENGGNASSLNDWEADHFALRSTLYNEFYK